MCTVTYIPQGNNQYTLTTSRDENKSRATSRLNTDIIGSEQVLYLVDPVSGGSWVAVSNSNRVVCVLNGAFTKHSHQPPYARSRGLVLLDFFEFEQHTDFISHYDFTGIEPFTMVIQERGRLIEFRWDGGQHYLNYPDKTQPNIWSSATLYDPKAIKKRKGWFRDWLVKNANPGLKDQMKFHRFGGEADLYNGLIMNRNDKVQTLSITGISSMNKFALLEHQDLIVDKPTIQRIDFSINDILESH